MSKFATTAFTLLLVAVPGLVACGDEQGDGTSAAQTRAATPAPTPKSEIPAALAGLWKVTLKRSELADPPDDLTKAKSRWILKFLGTGGTDNGPAMYFEHEEIGEIVQPVTVSGDRVTVLDSTPCRVFDYAVEGERLTFTSPEKGCPSTALSSVLTARPWRRTAS